MLVTLLITMHKYHNTALKITVHCYSRLLLYIYCTLCNVYSCFQTGHW